jgi:hypothetical protein
MNRRGWLASITAWFSACFWPGKSDGGQMTEIIPTNKCRLSDGPGLVECNSPSWVRYGDYVGVFNQVRGTWIYYEYHGDNFGRLVTYNEWWKERTRDGGRAHDILPKICLACDVQEMRDTVGICKGCGRLPPIDTCEACDMRGICYGCRRVGGHV